MDPSLVTIPPMKDLNIDNITANAVLVHSQGPDARVTYLFERLITHLHDFARETRLSTKEWMAAIEYLVQVGQKSSPERNEFILLSDVLGLSLLVDAIDHPKPSASTEGSVLGPFHTHNVPHLESGEGISSDPNGEPCLVLCSVADAAGAPIADVKIDIWEGDSSGHYDVQYADRDGPDGRGVMHSDHEGKFWFKAIRPVSYAIPEDGPVSDLLRLVHRHAWRPAHMHFMFEKAGWDHLITALYMSPDPYLTSDAVFGVKDSLIVEVGKVSPAQAAEYGVPEGTALVVYDFVLVSEEETHNLRDSNATAAMRKLFPGRKVKLLDHLPVPDVD